MKLLSTVVKLPKLVLVASLLFIFWSSPILADDAREIVISAPAYAEKNSEFNIDVFIGDGEEVNFTVTGACLQKSDDPFVLVAGNDGVCTIEAEDDETGETASHQVMIGGAQQITVTQAPPSYVSFQATFTVAATASSGLPVHISVDENMCELVNESESYALAAAEIRTISVGVCTIYFDQPGGEVSGVSFGPAKQEVRKVESRRFNQSIRLIEGYLPPSTYKAGDAFELRAVAEPIGLEGEERPVMITVANGSSCEVESSGDNYAVIKMFESGDVCTVFYDQAGNDRYMPAPRITREITLSQITSGDDIGEHWPTRKLFTTGVDSNSTQPIMSPPMVARNGNIKAPNPNVMVIFGTGSYHEEADLDDKSLQSIYGVHDRGEGNIARYKTNEGRAMLAKRTFTEETINGQRNRTMDGDAIDWNGQYGWYADLASDSNKNGVIDANERLGERSVFRPFLANKLFVFNTIQPVVGSCDGATQGWTMLIDWATGLPSSFPTYDVHGDGIGDNDLGYVGYFNETAGSELGRGGDSIFDTSGSEARRRTVTFGVGDDGVRIGWEEKTPYGVLKR